MVHGQEVASVLIAQFARAAGLTTDTVRFYVRKGLIVPGTGTRGGANPYQIFSPEHLEVVRTIRLARSLGLSLREIAGLVAEQREGRLTTERSTTLVRTLLARTEERSAELALLSAYLRAKLAWYEGGQAGPEPTLGAHGACPLPDG